MAGWWLVGALHYSTLYNILQYSSLYTTLQYCTLYCSTVNCTVYFSTVNCTILYCTMYSTLQYCTVHCTVHCSIVLYTVQVIALLWSALQYCTVQCRLKFWMHCTVQQHTWYGLEWWVGRLHVGGDLGNLPDGLEDWTGISAEMSAQSRAIGQEYPQDICSEQIYRPGICA